MRGSLLQVSQVSFFGLKCNGQQTRGKSKLSCLAHRVRTLSEKRQLRVVPIKDKGRRREGQRDELGEQEKVGWGHWRGRFSTQWKKLIWLRCSRRMAVGAWR